MTGKKEGKKKARLVEKGRGGQFLIGNDRFGKSEQHGEAAVGLENW